MTALKNRWPTALALVSTVGGIAVLALLDRDAELFGPLVAMMAAIYLMAYAIGRPVSVWLALVVMSALISVFHVLDGRGALGVHPGVAMAIVLALTWLWTVTRRRYADSGTFSLQTVGTVGFGAVTLAAAVEPRAAVALAGVGFLAHGAWDAYHYRVNKVVHRTYAEFCGVVDLVTGTALLVVAAAGGGA
ncbi:hypothetical protein [Micromonospora sp. CPCC 206061]|uniref:hypothetical protein n=1 Tax=Micromonospora sp. CPCC 206061 TaxID=3122410 RepID=UPI002FF26F6C